MDSPPPTVGEARSASSKQQNETGIDEASNPQSTPSAIPPAEEGARLVAAAERLTNTSSVDHRISRSPVIQEPQTDSTTE
ncbi:hypothetical protein N7508_002755 [Penicillium antarcticum]|uniref:uncharacterized protein n=1 Tax=Penicillium antarcticum TaxID=416450 RepID=UPI00238B9B96|nr:uncharacterized protein N7508_002755 [Penicillium antarcticum]KAJ5311925.1 hypothetical protein N7508_002755 [Penicillium antarcticum]